MGKASRESSIVKLFEKLFPVPGMRRRILNIIDCCRYMNGLRPSVLLAPFGHGEPHLPFEETLEE